MRTYAYNSITHTYVHIAGWRVIRLLDMNPPDFINAYAIRHTTHIKRFFQNTCLQHDWLRPDLVCRHWYHVVCKCNGIISGTRTIYASTGHTFSVCRQGSITPQSMQGSCSYVHQVNWVSILLQNELDIIGPEIEWAGIPECNVQHVAPCQCSQHTSNIKIQHVAPCQCSRHISKILYAATKVSRSEWRRDIGCL